MIVITKVKNILTMPKFICLGEEFTIDLKTIVQVCCGLDSGGTITVSLLDGQLTGPAEIIDFSTGVVSGCSNGCPNGSVEGIIEPGGKQIFIVFDEFNVTADGNIPGQSFVKKCCKTRIHLVANESNQKQPIMFQATISGDATTFTIHPPIAPFYKIISRTLVRCKDLKKEQSLSPAAISVKN